MTTFSKKILKQLQRRGWTPETVLRTIEEPFRTVKTRDTRYVPEGRRLDNPATGYINEDGSYVIRNDETGDIVQVSDRTDPNWKLPFQE